MTLWLAMAWAGAQAASVEGTVLDVQGNPVPGATIAAINPWFSATRTYTDSDGRYHLQDLDAGEYRIAAAPTEDDPRLVRYHPSGRSYCDGASIRLYPETARSGVDFVLPRGATLAGRLVDIDGLPVAGAGVSATAVEGASARRSTTTDEAGDFRIRGLDVASGGAEEWRVKAAVSGWPVQWLGPSYDELSGALFAVSAHGQTEIGTHTLLDGIVVGGQVTDTQGPIADATVRVYSSGQLIQGSTDTAGFYSVDGLPPGEVISWASIDGRGVTYIPDHDRPVEAVIANEEGDVVEDADIHMPAESRFSVQLQATANTDLTEISILLYNDTHTVGRGAPADGQGLATIDQLHGGDYHLFVFGADAGLADTWVRDESGELQVFSVLDETDMEPVHLQLAESVRIEGEVIDEEGLPVANAIVIATPPEEGPITQGSEHTFYTHTDGTGTFTLSGLPTGEWRVRTYVDPHCPDDPGYVSIYWPQRIDPALWEATDLHPEDGALLARFELPQDDDHDQMGDRWERRHRLDPSEDDSSLDPDEDGLSNLDEYRSGRDPHVRDGTWVTVHRCGCASAPGPVLSWLLPLMVLIRRRGEPTC